MRRSRALESRCECRTDRAWPKERGGDYEEALATRLIAFLGGDGNPDWIHLFVGDLSSVPNAPCAESLFSLARLPDLPNDHVVNGHFQILEAS
jgi:hypothetical protein